MNRLGLRRRWGRSEEGAGEQEARQALGANEGHDNERGENGEVECEGGEHPFGGLTGKDAARVEGGVFEHDSSLKCGMIGVPKGVRGHVIR